MALPPPSHVGIPAGHPHVPTQVHTAKRVAPLLAHLLRPHISVCRLCASLSFYSGGVPSTFFEEMAVFHTFGIVGNEFLFRAYEWIALHEAGLLLSPPLSPAITPRHGGTSNISRQTGQDEVSVCPSTFEALCCNRKGGDGVPGRCSIPAFAVEKEAWLAELLLVTAFSKGKTE